MKLRLILVLLILSAVNSFSFSQTLSPSQDTVNISRIDKRKFSIGFGFGFGFTTFKIGLVPGEIYGPGSDSLSQIKVEPGAGINLELIGNFRLNDQLDLRVLPMLSMHGAQFRFKLHENANPENDTTAAQHAEFVQIQFPIALKFKSKIKSGRRFFLQGGFQYQAVLNPKPLDFPFFSYAALSKMKTTSTSFFLGAGLEFFRRKMKIEPELRFVYSLKNLILPETTPAAPAVEDLKQIGFVFLLNFE